MSQYLVVEFEDNSIEAVPAGWFKKKKAHARGQPLKILTLLENVSSSKVFRMMLNTVTMQLKF